MPIYVDTRGDGEKEIAKFLQGLNIPVELSNNVRTRLYGKHSREQLLTWSQRRCCNCQRFLAIKELKYCKKCAKEGYLLVTKKLNFVTEQINLFSMETLREVVGIPLSKETRLWLRGYV